MNEELQIPNKESNKVEFKSILNDRVIEALVAFSNAKGGAVYVGVSDNSKITGITLVQETLPQFINEIKGKTSPSVIPDTEVIDLENGKKVVVLYVQEYPIKPVAFQGKYYKRVSASNHLLSVNEVANMHLQTMNTSWDACADSLHNLDDISLDNVQSCIEIMRKKGMTILESPYNFLLKYNLLRNEQLTNAAYLMFKTNDSFETTIELGRFQSHITIKDTARTKSNIITQVDEVIGFVKKHINCELIITGEPQHIEKWQYPLEAIREIVLNMIIHRDYHSSSDSIVKIFNDKIEFYNPGKLPDDMTVEDLLANRYKSTPRNKKIAELFKDLGLIEKYGSGIGRIVNYFKEANLPLPEFTNISGGFQVTVFTADVPDNISGNVPDVPDNISDVPDNRQSIIVEAIKTNPRISMSELSVLLNVNQKTIKRDIEKLKAKGAIKRNGSERAGRWIIISEEEK